MIRLIINFADSLFYITIVWHISTQPDSSFNLGIVIALFTVPEVIMFIFGPVIDRLNPKKLILMSIATQVGILLIMLTFNIIDFSLNLLILILIAEIMTSLTYPLEDTLIPRLVNKDEIVFANSLFAISYKVMDFIFNAAAAGFLIYFTTRQLYSFTMGFFLLALLPLLKLKVPKNGYQHEESFNYFKELKEGIHYVYRAEFILPLTIPLIFINFSVAMTVVAYPYYIQSFQNPEVLLAMFSFCAGAGSLLGTALVPKLSKHFGIGKMIILFLGINAVIWTLAFVQKNEWVMLAFVLVSYFSSSIYNVLYESLFQVLVPEKLLGRVNTLVDSLVTIAIDRKSVV